MDDQKALPTTNDINEEAEDMIDNSSYDKYDDCFWCIYVVPCVIGDVAMRKQ